MKNPLVYFKNVIVVFATKISCGKKLSIGWIQSFEKIILNIGKFATVQIGSFNQNRGSMYVGVPSGKLTIGSHCFFNINASITCVDSISIGDNCKFGNNLVIVDHDHNFKSSEPEFVSAPITIGNNVWCGANVVILKGTTVGDNCVIAAGSVVKGVVPQNTIVYQKKESIHCAIEKCK